MDAGPYGVGTDDRHPMPVSRRRFLQERDGRRGRRPLLLYRRSTDPHRRSTMPRNRDAMADQARHLRDAREPQLQQPVREVPGRPGTTTGVENGVEKAADPLPGVAPGDLPHDLAAHRLCVNGGAMDGFGTGLYGSTYAYTIFDEEQIPNYWHWAREYSLSENFFSSAGGPSYPNLLLHRRQLRRRLRQPRRTSAASRRTAGPSRAGDATRGEDVFVFVTDRPATSRSTEPASSSRRSAS